MKKALLFCSLVALGACSAAKDDGSSASRGNRTPVAHNTVVECALYDGMKKEATQLMTVASGMEVQVMDTVDTYFVKARVTNPAGEAQVGYMYRSCFSR
ncbi:hypothetical protein [Solirubrum puertoriconensis]|uniref:SH3b domain-containing protein n=1 Tax=Solirubrum puertoriconensis TaxID=1751427 RepID=A0A9X0L4Y9_SOLP1|nr:hypothetical protein [Solirubrum puertoriconensis]KUG07995.1 hypothetical protein ASU33_07240 [Solirubrum puertoriconensis]